MGEHQVQVELCLKQLRWKGKDTGLCLFPHHLLIYDGDFTTCSVEFSKLQMWFSESSVTGELRSLGWAQGCFLVVLCVCVDVPETCSDGTAAWLCCLKVPTPRRYPLTGELVLGESSDPHRSAFTVGNPSGRQNFVNCSVI